MKVQSPKRSPELVSRPVYPFTAIVGQEEMKLALLLNAIDPSIGGALLMGHRGTGKSTAVRALAGLLPPLVKVRGCAYGCDPAQLDQICADCRARLCEKGKLGRERAAVPVVDLPLGATEDRVCGTIDIERALRVGVKAFEPGLLARANRGFLYVDEVNLLEDHLVDLLLDVSVTGVNKVEREGVSFEHPARFVLIGSGNPEEGELRPQLIDRFGLHVEVKTELDSDQRAEIVEQRDAFERAPQQFCADAEPEVQTLRRQIVRARKGLKRVKLSGLLLRRIAQLCGELKVEGHRGELTIARAARGLAALEGRRKIFDEDVRRVATMALRHRLGREPLGEGASAARIERVLEKVFPEPADAATGSRQAGPSDDSFLDDDHSGGVKRTPRKPVATDQHGEESADSNEKLPAPPAAHADLPALPLKWHPRAKISGKVQSRRRRATARRKADNSHRGRYFRAVLFRAPGAKVALDATLRVALSAGSFSEGLIVSGTRGPRRRLPASFSRNLRFKRFARKTGALFILAIDTSGSMALNRINQAKGALSSLLRQAHVNGDRVAFVTFRGTNAEVLLPPSRSMVRARRVLDSLKIGGGTPLSAGLACALEVARRSSTRREEGQMVLLLFTDGQANVSLNGNGGSDRFTRRRLIEVELSRLGNALQRAGVFKIVVDTQNGFAASGEASALAEKLGAQYVQLPVGSYLEGAGRAERRGRFGLLGDLAPLRDE
jgi:magnesium chelatase subunit D